MNLQLQTLVRTQIIINERNLIQTVASMALYIGNPTNVIVSEAYKISFITYSAWMLLPTVMCILISYVVLRILFRGDYYLPRHIQPPDADPKSVLVDPHGAIFGLVLLACCLATLVGTSFASVPVWMVTLPFACVMFLRDIWHDLGIYFSHMLNHPILSKYDTNDIQLNPIEPPPSAVLHIDDITGSLRNKNHQISEEDQRSLTPLESQRSSVMRSTSYSTSVATRKEPNNKFLKPFYRAYKWFGVRFPTLKAVFMRMPWSILPFSLGMFILIEALAELGWVCIFATAMAVFAKNYVTAVFGMVFVSILACQLLNNLVKYK